MLSIIKAPHPVLSQQAKTINKIDRNIIDLISQMEETLEHTTDPEGVGLAAPQVGKSLSLFIAKPTPKASTLIFINPKILSESQTREYLKRPKHSSAKDKGKLEGCLSLRNIWGTVLRHTKVSLSYTDEQGKSHTKTFSDFLATIIQHEVDHLNGVLFPKRVLEQGGILYKSRKNKKNEEVFEEIEL